MSTDAKKLAQERLAAMVSKACDAIEADLAGTLVHARGSTKVLSARYVIDAVLDRAPDAAAAAPSEAKPIKTMGELAELSEYIRLKKQNDRREA
jgi:hypothetical protein